MPDKLLNKLNLLTNRSKYLIEHRHKSGKHYIKITQSTSSNLRETTTSSIHLNPAILTDLIQGLQEFCEEIPSRQLDDTADITKGERQKIKEAYLKGVTIKDLQTRFDYSEEQITKVLKSQRIAIVDQTKYVPPWNPYRKWRK